MSLLLSLGLAKPRSPRTTWLLAGQSNAGGLGLAAELAADLTGAQSGKWWQSGSFVAYNASTGTSENAGCHGLDARFMKARGDVDLIKQGNGGSSLVSGANSWNANDGNRWAEFQTTVATARALRRAQGYEPAYAGLIWVQGEADAGAGRTQAQYTADLRALIAASRAVFAADLRWFVVRLSAAQRSAFGTSAVDAIRAAQGAVGGDTRVTMIDSDAAAIGADNVHFTAAGLDSLGSAVHTAAG